MKLLSVVLPVFNEETLVAELLKSVENNLEKITENYQIVIIDDGSIDSTWKIIKQISSNNTKIKAIKFSRNFGHHYAITAGLNKVESEWVIVMDGDLQDRPEVIPELFYKANEGYEVVFVNRENRPETKLYLLLQKIYYFLLIKFTGIKFNRKQANFSIISNKVVEAFNKFPENARFYGSTIKWLGFKNTHISAQHGTRLSGKPSYTLRKRIKLASEIIISFSDRPLKIALLISFMQLIMGIILISLINTNLLNIDTIRLLSLISFLVLFNVSLTTFSVGIISLYIGKIFNQVKLRPLYIVEEIIN